MSDEWLRRLAVLSTADVGDALGRMGVVDAAIKPVWPGARFVGRAYTVWTRGGDNLLVHQALQRIGPGDALVVNGQGDVTRAVLGDRMAGKLLEQGGVGVVVDGAVRDATALQAMGAPVFARAVTPAGPFKHGPGCLQVDVAIGSVVVHPGDVIVADGDGVVVVPASDLPGVVVRAEAAAATEVWPVPPELLEAEGPTAPNGDEVAAAGAAPGAP